MPSSQENSRCFPLPRRVFLRPVLQSGRRDIGHEALAVRRGRRRSARADDRPEDVARAVTLGAMAGPVHEVSAAIYLRRPRRNGMNGPPRQNSSFHSPTRPAHVERKPQIVAAHCPDRRQRFEIGKQIAHVGEPRADRKCRGNDGIKMRPRARFLSRTPVTKSASSTARCHRAGRAKCSAHRTYRTGNPARSRRRAGPLDFVGIPDLAWRDRTRNRRWRTWSGHCRDRRMRRQRRSGHGGGDGDGPKNDGRARGDGGHRPAENP